MKPHNTPIDRRSNSNALRAASIQLFGSNTAWLLEAENFLVFALFFFRPIGLCLVLSLAGYLVANLVNGV
ncbi:uncharacterized protein EI90DRAFT_3071403 [Cantharellus anzutake]|uniref:uncharacterized protein n=1 Tax=Cantharellus anzutake TaxID=1750568 RepID=UPI001903F197|nr:uncharacterized protein EI90DRAFT_3071403 [Cantharellus anzutake]KAF8326071.1 hypothetical protein EI90DRAFT_3071403 [Cantharellus anzutake]